MEANLFLGKEVDVIPNWISWELLHNPGASFGLLSGFPSLLVILQIIIILFIIFIYLRSHPKSFSVQLGFALIISGALGNLIDRISLGYVIDFISFRWWIAIFNIADVEIRTGALLLLYFYLLKFRTLKNQ